MLALAEARKETGRELMKRGVEYFDKGREALAKLMEDHSAEETAELAQKFLTDPEARKELLLKVTRGRRPRAAPACPRHSRTRRRCFCSQRATGQGHRTVVPAGAAALHLGAAHLGREGQG